MSASAFPLHRREDDYFFSSLPDAVAGAHGVACPPGVDPIFALREEWLRAMAEVIDKTRVREWMDREAMRLHPATTAPNASERIRRQRARVLAEIPNARRNEEDALALEDALAERVLKESPQTIPGIVAKLQFLVRYGAPGPHTEEFPWPQLDALTQDLQRLTATDWVVFDP